MRSHSPTKVITDKSGIRNYLPPSSLVGLKSSVLVAYSPKTKHEIGSTVGLLGLLEFCGSGIVERSGGYDCFRGCVRRKFCFVLRRSSPTSWGEDMLCCGVARVDLRCCLASQKLSSDVKLTSIKEYQN